MSRHSITKTTLTLGTAPGLARADVFTPSPSDRLLPAHTASIAEFAGGPAPTWFFVTVCGGSGASLLTRFSRQPAHPTRDDLGEDRRNREVAVNCGRAWPDPRLETTTAVVVVTRTTMSGLAAAQDAAAQYLTGQAPEGLQLLGLVAVHDQPGRLPRPLASSLSLLAGVYRQVWNVPYVEAYRLQTNQPGDDCRAVHPGIAWVLDEIRDTVAKGSPR
jgi:uncharacterized protein DUF6668